MFPRGPRPLIADLTLIFISSDDSEDMEGKSTEFGLRSVDYDTESGGDESVSLNFVGNSKP